MYLRQKVVPYIGTWIETLFRIGKLSQVPVVPYIGTWIETRKGFRADEVPPSVVPYIGTWIETKDLFDAFKVERSYLI